MLCLNIKCFFGCFFNFLFAFIQQKNQQLPANVVAQYRVTLSKVITVVTHGYRFPLILRRNLFNWCQSWGPYGESPENIHTYRHAHFVDTFKKKNPKQLQQGLVNVVLQLVSIEGGVSADPLATPI